MKADKHLVSRIILLLGTLYFKLAWYSLLLNTLYSLTHLTPQHILLLSTLCSRKKMPQHTLLHGTLCFLEHFAFFVPESKSCCGEQRHKMFQGAKCSNEQSIPESQMCLGANCFRKQSVPWIKMC